MKAQTEQKRAVQPRASSSARPAGEQAITLELYQQIRAVVRELGGSNRAPGCA